VIDRADLEEVQGHLRVPRTFSSWKAAHALPASTSNLETVLVETSATLEIDRIVDPSQSIERIWTRVSRGSLFMPPIWLLFDHIIGKREQAPWLF